MKIKNVVSFASLLALAFCSFAFTSPEQSAVEMPEKVDDSFIEFLSLFDKVEMPYEIGLDDLKDFESKKDRRKKFSKKKSSSGNESRQLLRQYLSEYLFMSRMGPPEILPIARFYPNEKTIALIYMPYRSFGGQSELTFKMVLFDLKGNKIQNKKKENQHLGNGIILASTSPYSNTQTFSIDSNGLIIQKTYKTIWEKDLQKHGIRNNEITGYVLEKMQGFQIEESGFANVDMSTLSEDRASVN